MQYHLKFIEYCAHSLNSRQLFVQYAVLLKWTNGYNSVTICNAFK